jgi:murein DD-endopeptidase MepM/ murein hydrolase activator NlpD
MLLALALLAALPTLAWPASTRAQAQTTTATPAPSPFPLQLEVRTPLPPTAFPSNGQTHLAYELYLTNFSSSAMTLRSIEVVDAENSNAATVETFEGDELNAILKTFGNQSGAAGPVQIDAGEMVIAYMWVSFDDAAHVPANIRHRVNTTEASAEGSAIATRHTDLRVLSPPVRGERWTISDGPNNEPSNHHRRNNFFRNAEVSASSRYAIDWMQWRNRQSIADGEPVLTGANGEPVFIGANGEPVFPVADGEPVFAVADATVAFVRDGLPDNTPAPVETFRPVFPNSMATIGGNLIALDLGGGQYVWYAHLKPGTILVRPGERVRRGERLAQIGVSGDSNVPHLHFEVTNSSTLLAGQGLPYVFDSYHALTPDQTRRPHTRELPLGGMLVDIGESEPISPP